MYFGYHYQFRPSDSYKLKIEIILTIPTSEILKTEIISVSCIGETEFLSRQDFDQYSDQNWDRISNIWDKKLLLCYSDMMESMYKLDKNSKFGPMENRVKWEEREYELRVD
jgi:hypothetical protein